MSPRARWVPFERPYAPRIAVEGGVTVARPGRVSAEAAQELVDRVMRQTGDAIRSRGRTYARAGQVVELRLGPGTASAAVQGSDAEPYGVGLVRDADGRVQADCSCPYGSDAVEWCKHAAALAYVVADLVDRDAGMAARWTGDQPRDVPAAPGADEDLPDPAPEELAALVARLRGPLPVVDGAAQWDAAAQVLPLPGSARG